MSAPSIPVDLRNPGQVFACLGFLEAADVLLGDAEGGFDWSDEGNVSFALRAGGERNPFEVVLEFLAEAEPKRWGPKGYADPPPKKGKGDTDADDEPDEDAAADSAATGDSDLDFSPTFPAKEGDRMALPIRFGGGNRPVVELGHWADGSSRESFKLYAGNRSADKIARAMLKGVRKKATGRRKASGQPGDLKTKGLAQLWEVELAALVKAPFDVLTPMAGASISTRGAHGPPSTPASRPTNISMRSRPRPSLSFSRRGAWSTRVPTNSTCGKFDTPPGARACRLCWLALRSRAVS